MAQAHRGKAAAKSKGTASASFELKSASLSLLALVLKSADLAELAAELRAKLGDTPEVFNHDPLLIDLSQVLRPPQPVAAGVEGEQAQLSLDEEPALVAVDLAAIVTLLREYRMQPVAVKGANAAELAAAQALGLAEAPEVEATPAVREVIKEVEVVREVIREVMVPGEPSGAAKTMVIDKPLRSGQQVYAKGGDLVVLALVNHGAEVIADGSIHVYAPLRGKAIAGARGDTSARIFAASMEAELIAIAGTYRTTENPLPDTVLGKPAQIRLEGEKLVMEPLKL